MSLFHPKRKRILVALMAGCLFVSLAAHSVASSAHSAKAGCKAKGACFDCAVSLRSDSPEIQPVPLAVPYFNEITIASPVIIPEPVYHPPR